MKWLGIEKAIQHLACKKVIRASINGNVFVALLEDGTKIRVTHGQANPVYPESIDLKITDYCDLGCPYCHESSTESGKHCDPEFVLRYLDGLPSTTEIAIGGGNPLAHPELLTILQGITRLGLVANLTVNQRHVRRYWTLIERLICDNLVYGFGVSGSQPQHELYRITPHVVHHLIVGVHEPEDALRLPKVLVLGYKHAGRGKEYATMRIPIEARIERWKNKIKELLGKVHLAFDNLAIEQLELRSILDDDAWKVLYMGNDGEYSMYVDAVMKTFAVSSTSEQRFSTVNVQEDFRQLRALGS